MGNYQAVKPKPNFKCICSTCNKQLDSKEDIIFTQQDQPFKYFCFVCAEY